MTFVQYISCKSPLTIYLYKNNNFLTSLYNIQYQFLSFIPISKVVLLFVKLLQRQKFRLIVIITLIGSKGLTKHETKHVKSFNFKEKRGTLKKTGESDNFMDLLIMTLNKCKDNTYSFSRTVHVSFNDNKHQKIKNFM